MSFNEDDIALLGWLDDALAGRQDPKVVAQMAMVLFELARKYAVPTGYLTIKQTLSEKFPDFKWPKLAPKGCWRCVSCGGTITKPDDGWVEWFGPDDILSGFRITCKRCSFRGGLAGEPYGDHHLSHFLTREGRMMFFDYLIGKDIKHPAEIWRLAIQLFMPNDFIGASNNATP